MIVRMTECASDASEAARSLANTRWRGQVIGRAIETLRSRSNELDAQQLADLRAIADGTPGGQADGHR
jgi:hypothetical protein